MNILFVLNSTSLTAGATKSFLILLKGVIDQGWKPFVIVPDEGELCPVLRQRGIEVFMINFRPTVYPVLRNAFDYILFVYRVLKFQLLENKAIKKIVSICRDKHIDIIHTNSSVETVGLKSSKILSIPHIMHFREYADKDFHMYYFPSKQSYYSMVNQSGSYSICITKGIERYHQLNSATTRQIYNGITFTDSGTEEHTLGDLEKSNYFLFAGRIEPAKDVLQVVEAFNIVKCKIDSSIVLRIAGAVNDKTYMDKLLQFIHENGIAGRVIFMGPVKNMMPLMQKALAIVVSSKFEAFGRCLPEAMIKGCLTIGRDIAGTKEQFDNGLKLFGKEIGLRYQTTQELANHMLDIATSPASLYSDMKIRAKQTVEELYSPEQYVGNVMALYKDVLKLRNKK